MLLAGISELAIIVGILFCLITLPKHNVITDTICRLALLVTLSASLLGAVKFLTQFNISEYHSFFTYISKHFAVTAFIICAAWGYMNKPALRKIATVFLVGALTSMFINLFTELSLLSMATMLAAIIFTTISMDNGKHSKIYLIGAAIVLMSTLIWGGVINDLDLNIAIYHICVGGFYVLSGLSFKQNKEQYS